MSRSLKALVFLPLAALLLLGAGEAACAADAFKPKRILVVSTSVRNRFQLSIDSAEAMLRDLAAKTGAFTLEFVHQPEGQPSKPKTPEELTAGQRFQEALKKELEKLSPGSLKNYDAVVFCYTTGDLPLPDLDGLLTWIKEGHAFIGFGSANETMNKSPLYYDMLGGKWTHFKGTQSWIDLDLHNGAMSHRASRGVPEKFTIREFSYKIPNFTLVDPANTVELLTIDHSPTDNTPGHFPLAWARTYGRGRVFYTSVGGNQDLWNPELNPRKNSPEIAGYFRAHVLTGVEWALGLDNP